MPNHVVTEVVFTDINDWQASAVLAKVRGEQDIDFATLLPIPLNAWMGSSSIREEETFPVTALDWCTKNWSTKWNAYGLSEGGRYRSIVVENSRLILTFKTAWRTPHGWLVALFNTFRIPFTYTSLNEGSDRAVVGRFFFRPFDHLGWEEGPTDEAEHRRMHKLLWGVEQFEDDEPAPDAPSHTQVEERG